MNLIERIMQFVIVIGVGTVLLPEIARVVDEGHCKRQLQTKLPVSTRQTYKEYVQERLEVERMMK